MSKVDDYIRELRELADAEPFLLEHSGLPGPRGNLELARAAADVRAPGELRRWAALDSAAAPTGGAEEFLAFCGVAGLGRLLVEGDPTMSAELRRHASDERWRVREAVAVALTRWGTADFDALVLEMRAWAAGSWLERRAAAAGLCEPVLLTSDERVRAVLAVLDRAMDGVPRADRAERRSPAFQAFRKGLGYCWSVAAAAAPAAGRPAFEALVERAVRTGDRDLRWIARENLRKKRIERLGADWVAAMLARLA